MLREMPVGMSRLLYTVYVTEWLCLSTPPSHVRARCADGRLGERAERSDDGVLTCAGEPGTGSRGVIVVHFVDVIVVPPLLRLPGVCVSIPILRVTTAAFHVRWLPPTALAVTPRA